MCIGRSRKLSLSEDLPAAATAAAATAASEASRSVVQHIQYNSDSTSCGEKVVVVPGLEAPPKRRLSHCEHTTEEDSPYLPSPMGMAGMESAISSKGGSPEYLG